jgi:hypothetical protein
MLRIYLPRYINDDFKWVFRGASGLNVKSRRKGSPALERDLVHPGDAYTNMSVIPPVLCGSEGEICFLESKNSGRNLLRICSEGGSCG